MATTIEKLVDCFDTWIGDVQVARGGSFSRTVEQDDIESWGDGVAGAQAIDSGPISIAAELRCADPIIVPDVAALSWPVLVAASERVKNTATLRRLGIAHAMLTDMSMTINENAAGEATFSFRNRAVLGAVTTLAAEAPASTPASMTVPSSRNTIKILSATFTPVGGSEIPIRGMTKFAWQFAGKPMGSTATPGSDIDDSIDVGNLKFSGSIDFETLYS